MRPAVTQDALGAAVSELRPGFRLRVRVPAVFKVFTGRRIRRTQGYLDYLVVEKTDTALTMVQLTRDGRQHMRRRTVVVPLEGR